MPEKLNDKFFDIYENCTLFNNYENARNYFNNHLTGVKVIRGYFGLDYYAIYSVVLNELVIDDNIDREIINNEELLNVNKNEIYAKLLLDIRIRSKVDTMEDLKNYIKEEK